MRRGCRPCLRKISGPPIALQRVTSLPEEYLQELLHSTPEVLPVDEIDSSYGPLISLGREISKIDNLFVSPGGRLTIVETKLWRNPEATRQVVAQILDYAVRVSSWDYGTLENMARKALEPAPIGNGSLYEYVASKYPDEVLPEPEFVDAVQKSLSTGRFLLLIVGDGIRENIEAMVASLYEHPKMLFTFGLVQMQVFRSEELPGSELVVPQIIANSTEVVRAVVRVETTGQANVSVEIENSETKTSDGSSSRHTLSEDEFFSSISDTDTKSIFKQLLEFGAELGALPSWGTSSVSMKLRDPKGGPTRFTLFVLTVDGDLYTGWLSGQLERTGRDPEIAIDYVKKICELFPSVSPHPDHPDSLLGRVKASEIGSRLDEFRQVVNDLVDKINSS